MRFLNWLVEAAGLLCGALGTILVFSDRGSASLCYIFSIWCFVVLSRMEKWDKDMEKREHGSQNHRPL